jgi:hypothetical protein
MGAMLQARVRQSEASGTRPSLNSTVLVLRSIPQLRHTVRKSILFKGPYLQSFGLFLVRQLGAVEKGVDHVLSRHSLVSKLV